MSGLLARAQTPEVATGTVKKTLLQLVALANHRVKMTECSVSFKGVSNTGVPILVQLARQSDAGTSSALTPVKNNVDDAETLQTTARHLATVEPAEVEILKSWLVHPQGGVDWQAPFGRDIIINGGDRLGLVVTAAASVNAVASMDFEE